MAFQLDLDKAVEVLEAYKFLQGALADDIRPPLPDGFIWTTPGGDVIFALEFLASKLERLAEFLEG